MKRSGLAQRFQPHPLTPSQHRPKSLMRRPNKQAGEYDEYYVIPRFSRSWIFFFFFWGPPALNLSGVKSNHVNCNPRWGLLLAGFDMAFKFECGEQSNGGGTRTHTRTHEPTHARARTHARTHAMQTHVLFQCISINTVSFEHHFNTNFIITVWSSIYSEVLLFWSSLEPILNPLITHCIFLQHRSPAAHKVPFYRFTD